jgi:hypothetical protein
MRIMTVGLPSAITWAIRRDDPPATPLNHPAGWSVLNPLITLPEIFAPPHTTQLLCVVGGETCYFKSFALFLSVPDGAEDAMDRELPSLLLRMRYTSKQATLPAWPNLVRVSEVDALPEIGFPAGGLKDARVRDYLLDAPVTLVSVREAGSLASEFRPPVYDTLFLDATLALRNQNYRTAILYAAISIEALASTLIAEEHERLISATPPSDTIRHIVVLQAGGRIERIDPIYRHLTNSTNFRVLLLELPLYVLRRSLFSEDRALYDRALCLYRTRNNLAHRGHTDEQADVLPLSHAGAVEALECAAGVFAWFGAGENYAIPRGEWRRI